MQQPAIPQDVAFDGVRLYFRGRWVLRVPLAYFLSDASSAARKSWTSLVAWASCPWTFTGHAEGVVPPRGTLPEGEVATPFGFATHTQPHPVFSSACLCVSLLRISPA